MKEITKINQLGITITVNKKLSISDQCAIAAVCLAASSALKSRTYKFALMNCLAELTNEKTMIAKAATCYQAIDALDR